MKNSIKINKIALPQEHGSWGFVLEPLILSISVYFSLNGLLIALAAFFIFLLHQPIKSLSKFQNTNIAKAQLSLVFVTLYVLIVMFLLIIPLMMLPLSAFVPFGAAMLIMLGFLIYELKVKKKNFALELSAPASVDLLSLTILFANGASFTAAAAFFVLLLSRSVESAIYVHVSLERLKGKRVTDFALHLTNLAFALALILLVLLKTLPPLSLLAFAILILRSYNIFNTGKLTVKGIGIKEFVYGALFVAINILGFYL